MFASILCVHLWNYLVNTCDTVSEQLSNQPLLVEKAVVIYHRNHISILNKFII